MLHLQLWNAEPNSFFTANWFWQHSLEIIERVKSKHLLSTEEKHDAYLSHVKVQLTASKQMFPFENFRVRKLVDINALNFYITLCMAFWAHILTS